MKITDIKIEKYHIPMKFTFKISFCEVSESTNIIVKVITDEGVCGYGEAAPFEPVTGESTDQVILAIEYFKHGLIGMDAMDLEGIHKKMDLMTTHNTSAKCAIDIALYDIRGKVMNQPLYKVLGGSNPNVDNDVTIGISTPEQMVEEAVQHVNDGYHILKIKVGIHPEEDLYTLKKMREAVGPNVKIRVDANQGYSVAVAIDTLLKMKEIGIDAVEQCLPSWDLEGHAYVRKQVQGIKIMLDESLHSPYDAAKAAKLGAADTFNIKLMKCGGLYPATKINAIGEANGINCMVGCMLESKIGITAGMSLVAALSNVTEADCDSFLFAKDPEMGMTGGFVRNGGDFSLVDKPGLGLDISF